MLPFGSNDVSMLWQAESGFYFAMPEGYVSAVIPQPFVRSVTVAQLVSNTAPRAAVLGSFIRAHHVAHVVVDGQSPGIWPNVLRQLGLSATPVGGTLLYAVRPARRSARTASASGAPRAARFPARRRRPRRRARAPAARTARR